MLLYNLSKAKFILNFIPCGIPNIVKWFCAILFKTDHCAPSPQKAMLILTCRHDGESKDENWEMNSSEFSHAHKVCCSQQSSSHCSTITNQIYLSPLTLLEKSIFFSLIAQWGLLYLTPEIWKHSKARLVCVHILNAILIKYLCMVSTW